MRKFWKLFKTGVNILPKIWNFASANPKNLASRIRIFRQNPLHFPLKVSYDQNLASWHWDREKFASAIGSRKWQNIYPCLWPRPPTDFVIDILERTTWVELVSTFEVFFRPSPGVQNRVWGILEYFWPSTASEVLETCLIVQNDTRNKADQRQGLRKCIAV